MTSHTHRTGNRGRDVVPAWLYISPAYVLITGVLVVPVTYAAWLSVHEVRANIWDVGPFVGLANYALLIASPDFQAAAWRTLYFVAVSLAIQLPAGLAIALLLNRAFPGRGLVRALVLVPWALPTIVSASLWAWIYQAGYGALNGFLLQVGLIDRPILWLGSPGLAMNMIIVADTWKVLPFYVMLFLAGLQTISPDLYEAARVDGASRWQQLWNVTLPSLRPVILIILVLRTAETFRVFDIVFQMTQGGPAGGTTVLAYQAYLKAFWELNFGQGAAASFIITLVVLAIAAGYIRILNREAGER